MKAKRQLRYLLERSYLDCSESRSSAQTMPLLITGQGGWSVSDGVNSIKIDSTRGAFGSKPPSSGSLWLLKDCSIELEQIGEAVKLSLKCGEATLIMPWGGLAVSGQLSAANQTEFRLLEDDLTPNEKEFLKNVLFEKKVRSGEVKRQHKQIELDEMLEMTSESVHLPKAAKRVKRI